ncbi:MAG: response regulator [Spirochaetaceae bacterium]|jgi:PAS domain S-box-containing protein|nr:response regulator [Spirochaetaceae bacterium]
MKPFLLLSAFLLFCSHAAEAGNGEKGAFYIDLRGGNVFVREGFDAAYTVINPVRIAEDYSPGILVVEPGKSISNADISRLRGKKKMFLSLARPNIAENTVIIPFALETEAYRRLDEMAAPPALYLAGAGGSWEAYLNGRLAGRNTGDGMTAGNAGGRRGMVPLDKGLFREGENILGIRITGEEFDRRAGFRYSGPYYIAEEGAARGVPADLLWVAVAAVSLVFALFFVLWFFLDRREKPRLFFALTSLFCGLYFITKMPLVYGVVPAAWLYRAELAILMMIPPFLLFFWETSINGATRWFSRRCFYDSLAVAVIQIPLSLSFNADLSRLWQLGAMLILAYMVSIDLFIPFGKEVQAALAKRETKRVLKVVGSCLKLPVGNLAFAAFMLLACSLSGIIIGRTLSVETHLGAAGGFVFIVIAAFSLVSVSANSIAARKTAHANAEQTDYLHLILKNSPEMLVLFDSEYRIVDCAASLLDKLPGVMLNDLVGKDYREIFKDFLDDGVLESLSLMFQNALAQKKTISIFESINFSGKEKRQYEIHFSPMFREDGSLEGSLLFLSDMTDMLMAVQKADQANRAKTSFLATMSHEIRTPLNAILGLAEIQLMNQLPPKTRTDLEKIYLSGGSLLQIINDILDLSKIETNKFPIEPDNYDLAEVINDCVQSNITRISEKPIHFSIEINETIPLNLYGDELRIKQVVNNILSNAFKYTKRGNVTLIIDYEKVDDQNIVLLASVKDTGIGIKEEDREILFGDYTRFDKSENKFIEGTGLGLSITKKLVEMMDGAIILESEYGKGSTFRIRLPQTVTDNTPLGEETAAQLKSFHYHGKKQKKQIVRKDFKGKKLLVVDDVAMNIDVAKGLLALYGIEVHEVSSGKTAVEVVRSSNIRYDMIVMDHMMPEMSGVDAARIIRNQIDSDYARTVPIIAFTANAIPENQEIFFANGFNGYLTKPIDAYELDDVLNKFLDDAADDADDADESRLEGIVETAGDTGTGSSGLEEVTEITGEDEHNEADDSGYDFPMLDMESAIQNFVETSVFINILKKAVLNLPPMLEEIKNPTAETLKDYAVKIHGLKGAVYGIYYKEGGDIAATLEKSANEGDLDAVLALNDDFIALVTDFIETVGEKLQVKNAETTRAIGNARLLDRLDKNLFVSLREAAEQYRINEMREIIQSIEKHRGWEYHDLIPWLRGKIENLEYHDIVTRLASIETETEKEGSYD